MTEEVPEPEPEVETSRDSEPELEPPEPEPPKAKAPGRPKKEPGAAKSKYAPRKPREPVREPEPIARSAPEPIDERVVARQVVGQIGQLARNRFEARRGEWREMVASNYRE